MRTLIRLFFLLLVTTTPAYADHEPNHRYEVQGYLLDANRNPVPGVGIAISSGNQILGNAVSEDNGFYYMKLHLHDTSIGRKLQISTADFSGTIVMKATAGDKTTRRLHYANFIGGKLQERPDSRLGREPLDILSNRNTARPYHRCRAQCPIQEKNANTSNTLSTQVAAINITADADAGANVNNWSRIRTAARHFVNLATCLKVSFPT